VKALKKQQQQQQTTNKQTNKTNKTNDEYRDVQIAWMKTTLFSLSGMKWNLAKKNVQLKAILFCHTFMI
jgi:hypothetical protein